jgi:hypothetical protein
MTHDIKYCITNKSVLPHDHKSGGKKHEAIIEAMEALFGKYGGYDEILNVRDSLCYTYQFITLKRAREYLIELANEGDYESVKVLAEILCELELKNEEDNTFEENTLVFFDY